MSEDEREGIDWSDLIRNASLVVVVLLMVWLAFNIRLPSVDALQSTINSYGWWGWLAFIGLYAVVAVTPIPVSVMALLGGVLFGIWEGTVLSIIGATIGCWIAYWIARGLGHSVVMRLLGKHADTVRDRLETGGFLAVSLLRLTPGIPYWPVNYGAGAFRVTNREFLLATVLCAAPGQLSLVAVGAFVSEPTWFNGVVVVASWIGVLILTGIVFRRLRALRRAAEVAETD